MSSVVIAGDTSGTVTLDAPAVAGTTVLTLPATSGTVLTSATGQTLTSPVIAGTPTGVGVLTSGTAVASTSGTSIDFTGIPSWVKRITVMLNGVSTAGSIANMRFQLGTSSGVEVTGYSSMAGWLGSGSTVSASTSGFDGVGDASGTLLRFGTLVFTTLGSNIWTCLAQYSSPTNNFIFYISGGKTLSSTLDRVRITTTTGTDTFDAGSINILYE